MPRPCSVCAHEESFAVNEALVVERASYRDITRRFGLSKDAVARHREHIPRLLVEAAKHTEEFETDTILMRVEDLGRKTLKQLESAEDEVESIGDRRVVLNAIREQRENLRLVAEIRKLIDQAPQVNVLVNHPEWIELRGILVTALEPYTAAKRAVVEALEEAEKDPGSAAH